MNYNSVLCVGDSITFGSRDDKNSNYPLEMEAILEEKAGGMWLCVGDGICGETSVDLIRRFYKLVSGFPRVYEVCLFEGVNDAKDEKNTLPEIYSKNMEHCIKVCKILGKKLFLGTIPEKNGNLAPSYGKNTNDRVKKYNHELELLAQKYDLELVDLSALPKECYADGIHFNNSGHREIARRFSEAILKERGI